MIPEEWFYITQEFTFPGRPEIVNWCGGVMRSGHKRDFLSHMWFNVPLWGGKQGESMIHYADYYHGAVSERDHSSEWSWIFNATHSQTNSQQLGLIYKNMTSDLMSRVAGKLTFKNDEGQPDNPGWYHEATCNGKTGYEREKNHWEETWQVKDHVQGCTIFLKKWLLYMKIHLYAHWLRDSFLTLLYWNISLQNI